MKRFFTLAAVCLSLVTVAVTAPAALAADSTCSTHVTQITGWSKSTNRIDTHWDYQCGGANNEDYQLRMDMQWKDGSGVWHTFDCTNGLPCRIFRPGALAFYNGGTEHAGNESYQPVADIACFSVRSHITVIFEFSPQINYNSATTNIPC